MRNIIKMICNKTSNKASIRRAAALILLILFVFIVCAKACHETTDAQFYILMWTRPTQYPFTIMKMAKNSFTENDCHFQNCFITSHILQLSDVTYFDAVLFNAEALRDNPEFVPPNRRHKDQKYVLVSTGPATKYEMPEKFNSFFNWTWTYKLNSDVMFAEIAIKDSTGTVIGPREDINWIPLTKMLPTSTSVSKKLSTKSRAAAWYLTDCEALVLHSNYIKRLRNELRAYYFTVDILGPCENVRCNTEGKNMCSALIESNYYFYLAFENDSSEDYVTNQLLMGLNNYAVPVVFGGANYTRYLYEHKFMPDGIYLNAVELGPEELAKKMFEIISDRKAYHNMFKWRKYYTYHDPLGSPDTNVLCAFCELLNNDQKRKEQKVYRNINKWLNENGRSNATPQRVLEIEVFDSMDKNKHEIINEFEALPHWDLRRKESLNSYRPKCSSVVSCAGNYFMDIKKKVLSWFNIKPM